MWLNSLDNAEEANYEAFEIDETEEDEYLAQLEREKDLLTRDRRRHGGSWAQTNS